MGGEHEDWRPSERERRAWEREMLRRLEELDRLDEEHGLGVMPGSQVTGRPAPRRRRSRARSTAGLSRGTTLLTGLLAMLLLAVVVAVHPSDRAQAIRSLVGAGAERLGVVPEVARSGPHAFLATQPGSGEPVGYDPCRPVEIVVNPDGAPESWRSLVATAVERTSQATGLRLEVVGETDDRTITDRGAGPGAAPPVLVAWADEEEVPELEGDVAGIGGSTAVGFPAGRQYFTTGIVVLDTDDFAEIEGRLGGRDQMQAIVDHEFGHLVGLDHVDDPGELMYAENVGRTDYGPGDREGFARLGSIPCR